MNFIDTSGIPLMLVGTPDAEAVLQKRFAVSQRLTTGGKIKFEYPSSHNSPEFILMLKVLEKYQWSDIPLVVDEELQKFIYLVTAGIRRLVISLWRASHRVAIDSESRNLTADHFKMAAAGALSHTRPAVDALLDRRPDGIIRFEDLMSSVDWED